MSTARRFARISTPATKTRSVILGDEPVWLTFEDVSEIHAVQLHLFGGLAGTKDENLVQSAVAAPQNLYRYDDERDLLVLAIRLCVAVAKNHGFVDGNKRTATAAMIEFLAINGYDLFVPDDEEQTPLLGQWIEKAVAGDLDRRQLYDRLEHFLQEQPY